MRSFQEALATRTEIEEIATETGSGKFCSLSLLKVNHQPGKISALPFSAKLVRDQRQSENIIRTAVYNVRLLIIDSDFFSGITGPFSSLIGSF